jgi:catechol 2,3-dioxygenase-like lactoylglutathione lyase family enzyme
MELSIGHTGFVVSDMESSLAFYCDILGLPVVDDVQREGDYIATMVSVPGARVRTVFLDACGHTVELVQYLSGSGSPVNAANNAPGKGHISFWTSDIQADYERLRSKGVEFVSSPQYGPTGGAAVYFLDPDGITVELHYRPDHSG